MPRMIFVNLPVGHLDASMDFYQSIGFENNAQFSDETAACMVWSEAIHVMLLTHAKWRTFTDRPIPPAGSSEVALAISLPDRAAVDAMSAAAAARCPSRAAPCRAVARFARAGGRGRTAEQPTSIPCRTSASCTAVAWPTPTGMCGNPSGWTRRRFPRAISRAEQADIPIKRRKPRPGFGADVRKPGFHKTRVRVDFPEQSVQRKRTLTPVLGRLWGSRRACHG